MTRHKLYAQTPQVRLISKAVKVLRQGGLVVYPTDTVYGVGCSIEKREAIERLYKLKGKPREESLTLICSSIQQAAQFVYVTNPVYRILKRCMPGQFTIILEARPEIRKFTLSRQKEIGVRIPDNPVCQMLVEELGGPLFNTSLEPPDDGHWDELLQEPNGILRKVDMILDGGTPPFWQHSTVARIRGKDVEILREGAGDANLIYD